MKIGEELNSVRGLSFLDIYNRIVCSSSSSLFIADDGENKENKQKKTGTYKKHFSNENAIRKRVRVILLIDTYR